MLEIRALSKSFSEADKSVRVLDGLDLKLERGQTAALLGESGSGKTTLLNLIGGLGSPSIGTVHIEGKGIHELSDNELINFRLQHIGFVFQAYNLIPVLSAQENVEFIMLLQGDSAQSRGARAKELLKAVGLEQQMHKRPSELSGGQQQRVAVARALASKPSFVLADEPTANLDSKSTEDLLDIMHRLNKEEGITFLFSTHDQRVIDRAERLIYVEDGKIKSDVKQ